MKDGSREGFDSGEVSSGRLFGAILMGEETRYFTQRLISWDVARVWLGGSDADSGTAFLDITNSLFAHEYGAAGEPMK